MSGKFQIQPMPEVNGAPKHCDANTCIKLKQRVNQLESLLHHIGDLNGRILTNESRADYHIGQVLDLMSIPKGQLRPGFSWMSHAAGYKRRTLKNKRQ